jgi:hypothetical protein
LDLDAIRAVVEGMTLRTWKQGREQLLKMLKLNE